MSLTKSITGVNNSNERKKSNYVKKVCVFVCVTRVCDRHVVYMRKWDSSKAKAYQRSEHALSAKFLSTCDYNFKSEIKDQKEDVKKSLLIYRLSLPTPVGILAKLSGIAHTFNWAGTPSTSAYGNNVTIWTIAFCISVWIQSIIYFFILVAMVKFHKWILRINSHVYCRPSRERLLFPDEIFCIQQYVTKLYYKPGSLIAPCQLPLFLSDDGWIH